MAPETVVEEGPVEVVLGALLVVGGLEVPVEIGDVPLAVEVFETLGVLVQGKHWEYHALEYVQHPPLLQVVGPVYDLQDPISLTILGVKLDKVSTNSPPHCSYSAATLDSQPKIKLTTTIGRILRRGRG